MRSSAERRIGSGAALYFILALTLSMPQAGYASPAPGPNEGSAEDESLSDQADFNENELSSDATLDDPLLDGLLGEADAVVEPEDGATPSTADDAAMGHFIEVELESSQPAPVQRVNPLRGEFRVAAAFLNFEKEHPLDAEDDALLTAIVRGILSHSVGEAFAFELNSYLNLSRIPGGGVNGAFTTAGSSSSAYRSPHLAWEIWDSGHVGGEVGVDRVFLSWQKRRFSGAFGRFPINHSVTQILTPNDFFAPFSATAINTAYKPGVDALRLAVSMGRLSSIEIDAVLGYDEKTKPTWPNMALLARLATVQWGFEWALIGGKVAERWISGASIQGDIRGFNIRAEGHLGLPDKDGDGELDEDDREPHGRAAIGFSGTFPWQNLSLGLEYGFMSDGALDPDDYGTRASKFFPDDLSYLAGHYLGANLSLEIVPIVTTSMISLVNLVDGSGLIGAFAAYSASDRADFNLGIYLPWGDDSVTLAPVPRTGSEFGLSPLMIFLDTRVYF